MLLWAQTVTAAGEALAPVTMQLPGAGAIIASLIGVLGTAFGLLGWIFKRTFGHTIPRIAKDFATALELQRKEFLAELDREREMRREERREFLDEIGRMRETQRQERQECMEKVESLRREVVTLGAIVHNDFHKRGP